ncbi:ABC transporter permease [Bradyrhizobium sp. dw_78]|uniref:ABC transporter permease n=1 Tax=Bradyrhizobium sp. dw_78 TaxID=2719793 RepID=UPI001BD6C9A6|nr:ABC transporter permease [Bradyrhizobium sp. dw_78]
MRLSRFAPALTLISALLAWQAICVVFSVPAYILPRPSQVVMAATEVPIWTWLDNIGATLEIVLAGFCISFAIAIPLAMLLVNSPLLSSTIVPLLVVIQSTPIVAIAPILVVSLGAGALPRTVITCLITFFPLVIATAAGLRSAPAELIELSESLKAPRFRQYTQIRLPYAVPHIIGAAKVAVTLAVIGAVVAEFVAADKGLGYMILNYTAVFKLGRAFFALIVLLCISLSLYQVVALIERTFFSWSLPERR